MLQIRQRAHSTGRPLTLPRRCPRLGENDFDGPLPGAVGFLSNLTHLDLSGSPFADTRVRGEERAASLLLLVLLLLGSYKLEARHHDFAAPSVTTYYATATTTN